MNHFPKSGTFPTSVVQSKIMGPSPLKLCEELLCEHEIPQGAVVLDLGSGTGITSCMLAREYGFVTYAVDLWSDPGENMRFFEEMGLSNKQICPIKADAAQGLHEAWADWLACDNEYATGDRASMEAGAGRLLNSIGIALRRL